MEMSDSPERKRMDMEIVDANEVVAKVSKETLKSLLYMVAGKPDSNIKLFRARIRIQPSDIVELNDMIQQKLSNHDVAAAITTVSVNYLSDEIEQYGVWAEFVEHKWNTHKETESITVKWDFIVKLPLYQLPQRHTVVVKIASKITPLHVMQAMFSKDPDEMENLDSEIAPCVCRIDFINHVLSDEIMRIVEQWHKARIKPLYDPTYEKFLKKHKTAIARTIHYSIPFFATTFAAGVLNKYVATTYATTASLTVGILKEFMFWLLGSAVVIAFMLQIGRWIASSAFDAINSYGEHAIFDFTNGDKNRQNKLEQKNKDAIKKFSYSVAEATIVNLISAAVTYLLFK
jgi:hypothetical protein